MRQFDVYTNPSKSTRKAYPFIVDIQSEIISELATRIVVPLGRKVDFRSEQLKKLTPTVEYEGEELLLLVPQVASIPTKALKNPIGSLSHLRDDIVAALDFAITGI
ncbi:plasmid maintenance protein CcdB [Seongchinamella sediminis]|uniref:Toxin CcdB n=1 Tax=Seongchinamella sediminis TaxID=2283635 RepID=A0A3L7DTG6_9GAMM|nr:CcdB family protein [Seongchinamella sediminis]RLQ20858.1 plasmid maintenance protein CcdB [Seongchinamella sediminis]